MIIRNFWLQKIEQSLKKASILWLSGVRRVGKTTLTKQLSYAQYYNCDLPSVQRQLSDPEFFLSSIYPGQVIILDEVHRTDNPSMLLKIAADEYPQIKIVATGSSTLAATKKFRDSLTGRKRSLYLAPVLWSECLGDFNLRDFDKRLLHGGLPEVLLEDSIEAYFFEEWISSFYARDIQELFGFRNRGGFLKLLELLFLQSGGQYEVGNLAMKSGLSRPTVIAHTDAMEIAHAVFRIPPYHGGGKREIIRQPKIYVFDTGLVSYIKGWQKLRENDRCYLWEHLVIDELRTIFSSRRIHYWRDKSQREIDFVIEQKPGILITVEAKVNPASFSERNFLAFRDLYPEGQDYIVCPFIERPYQKKVKNRPVTICGVQDFRSLVSSPAE